MNNSSVVVNAVFPFIAEPETFKMHFSLTHKALIN